MTARRLALLLACLLLPHTAQAEPAGSYQLVDIRRMAGVAGPAQPANPDAASAPSPFPPEIRLGGAGAADETCSLAGPLPEAPLDLADPILSDLAWGLAADGMPGWRIRCPGAAELAVAAPDGRVLVAVSRDGTLAGLYEAPLPTAQLRRLQQALRERGFLDRPPGDSLDADTLAALGQHLESLGLPYRFRRPVLTEALQRDLAGR